MGVSGQRHAIHEYKLPFKKNVNYNQMPQTEQPEIECTKNTTGYRVFPVLKLINNYPTLSK
jgi:hypothetical protein